MTEAQKAEILARLNAGQTERAIDQLIRALCAPAVAPEPTE